MLDIILNKKFYRIELNDNTSFYSGHQYSLRKKTWKKIVSFYIFVAVTCFFSCTTDPVLIDADSLSEYYVRSKISPNVNSIGVIVGKTFPENMPDDIGGARVTVTGAQSYVLLKEWKPGRYIDAAKDLSILPGHNYNLSITLPEGNVINGRTTVPGDFGLVDAIHSDTLEYTFYKINDHYLVNSLASEISWNKSLHALSYRVFLEPLSGNFPAGSKTTIDTNTVVKLYRLHHNIFMDSFSDQIVSKYLINITAFDSSYIPYLSNGGSLEEEDRITQLAESLNAISGQNDNIEGGVGYFASSFSVQDTVIVRLKLEKQQDNE